MTRLVWNVGAYRLSLAAVVASTFLSMLAYSGPLGNVVALSRALGTSPAGTAWILASMSVGLAVSLLAAGVVADEIGHRRVFGIGAAVFAVANLACALAPSGAVFVGARIVVGLGATGMVATGLGLVAAVTAHERQQSTTATWWSVAMGSGIALGPIMTGLFDLWGGWRAFYAVLAATGLVLWRVTGLLPCDQRAAGRVHRRFDIVGFALLTTALGSLVTAIVQVRVGATTSATAMFLLAAALTVGLVVSQRARDTALLDTELFRHPRFLAANLASFGTGLGVIAAMSFACSFFVLGINATTLQAGVLLAAWSGTSAVAALVLSHVISAATSGTGQLVGGLVGVAAGLVLLSRTPEHAEPLRFLPGLVVAGIASGLLNTGLARESVASVPRGNAAMGTGANNTARYIGSSIGVTIASAVAAGSTMPAHGWNNIAMLAAVTSLGCAVLVAGLAFSSSTPTPTGNPERRPR